MFIFGLTFFHRPMRDEIDGPDELNPLPTTVDERSFNSFRAVPGFVT